MADSILDGRVALVTGAASGIGAATAARLREAGAKVAGLDLIEAQAVDLALVADLADPVAVAAACVEVAKRLGSPDILIHCAAASVPGGCLDTDAAEFTKLYDVNVAGAVRVLAALIPEMRRQRRGAIVLLSSINARFATPTLAAYATTKAALESLTLTAALEFAADGIRINAIAPASIDTPLLRSSFDLTEDPAAAREANVGRHPLGRLGLSEEVADLALFLVSDQAAWITGAIVPIDGGAHVTRR